MTSKTMLPPLHPRSIDVDSSNGPEGVQEGPDLDEVRGAAEDAAACSSVQANSNLTIGHGSRWTVHTEVKGI